jgi:hypothetical protein
MQVKAANKPAEDEFINAKYFSKRRYHEHPEYTRCCGSR